MNAIARLVRRHQAPATRGLAFLAILATLAATACEGGESLAGPTWHWTAHVGTDGTAQSNVADPAHYMIEFHTDGTATVTADCNTVTGTYAAGVPLDLSIQLGSTTLADCGDTSLDRLYLESLGRVTSYTSKTGELTLLFEDDVGGMRFNRA
jgi:heat shock protein HslJ